MILRNIRRLTPLIRNTYFCSYRRNSTVVLGIETSCDDTGCAVVNSAGQILGESLYSQNALHIRYGGINPRIARVLHLDNIDSAVQEALERSNLKIQDIDAVAVTTMPGLIGSLQVGVKYAKYLARKYSKPLLPIHHMEAHSLMPRMLEDIPFPYLVLLISGGHCLLAVVRDVDNFLLLGSTLDNAPGEVMDKVARRLKLKNMPEYAKLAGGQAIEVASKMATNPNIFESSLPLNGMRDCNFSFSGLKDFFVRKVEHLEEKHGISVNEVIPEVNDICAAFQLAVTKHLVHRTARAIEFCENNNLIERHLVISGGVACNDFIFKSFGILGDKLGYKVYRPPPRLCTDNGAMVAWNGIEKLKKQHPTMSDIDMKDIQSVAPLGVNYVNQVIEANLHSGIKFVNQVINANLQTKVLK